MDLRTGRIYDSKDDALNAGVPESDLAEIHAQFDDPNRPTPSTTTGRLHMLNELKDCPAVSFTSGPFNGRTYKRTASGNLVRCK